jgi:hypothetical protein
MTDVPVIPSGNTQYDDSGPPLPPQQAETPVSVNKESRSLLARQSLTNLRQSVDDKLLSTSDDKIKQVWKAVNGGIGLLIMLNGVLRIVGVDTAHVYDLNVFVMSLWLIIFGLLFILIELKLPKIDTVFKANIDFMFFPGFRAFFLTFVGTMQWTWWLGITVSVFCFLGAIFNFYVMKTHPAFGHSSNLQDYEPPDHSVPAKGAPASSAAPMPPTYDDRGYGNATL